MNRVRSMLAGGAYVDVPARSTPPPVIDPFQVLLEEAIATLRDEMQQNLDALTTQLTDARVGAEKHSAWIQVANDKANEARDQLGQALTAYTQVITELNDARQANTALMQALDAERKARDGMEQRLASLINQALGSAPLSHATPIHAPTYRMRVTSRDANNRPTDILLTPEAP